LVTALQTLRITGEVITTPYSFAATVHSLLRNDITPVFVDIDHKSCNLLKGACHPMPRGDLPLICL
jgi:dTDP-4-amino-4,6-dideoxygalactose transaminase